MFKSVPTGQGARTGRERLGEAPRLARKGIIRVFYAAAAAAITLGTLGFAGAGSPASAATGSIGPPEYTENWAGYSVGGRLFRFISTTLTVPGTAGAGADIGLSHGQPAGQPFAELEVVQEGGPGGVSVRAHVSPGDHGTLPLNLRAGDQLTISIYYDRHGHDYFTASDTTQHITRTIRLSVGSVVYNHGFVISPGGWPGYPPQTDTQMLQFTGTRTTTYSGTHGNILGPWATTEAIDTTDGTPAGTVVMDATVPSNNRQDFSAWLRRDCSR